MSFELLFIFNYSEKFFKARIAKVIYIYKTNSIFFKMNFNINPCINLIMVIIIILLTEAQTLVYTSGTILSVFILIRLILTTIL